MTRRPISTCAKSCSIDCLPLISVAVRRRCIESVTMAAHRIPILCCGSLDIRKKESSGRKLRSDFADQCSSRVGDLL